MCLASLCAAYLLMCRAVLLFLCTIDMGNPSLELSGLWVELGLSVEIEAFGRALPINVPWGQEFSGGSQSWIWVSNLKRSSLTSYCRTKTSQVTKNRRQNSKTFGEGNA